MKIDERRLLDQIEHAVFALEPDQDGVPRYCAFNRFCRRTVGKSEDDVIGNTACDLYPGRLGRVAFEHHQAVIQSGKERSYEILLPIGDGQRRVRTNLQPVLDEQGRVIRIMGSSTDLSGIDLAREAQAKAVTTGTEMEDFIALSAHDLRSPMRHIGVIADMLREDFEDLGDGKLDLIDMLEGISEKAMSLIGDILSHAQATSTLAEVVEFDFPDLVQEVMVLLDPMDKCRVTVSPGLVSGDRTATQMVLRNLIDNALRYAGQSQDATGDTAPPALHLTITLRDADGHFEVSVRDNGLGFGDVAILFLSGGKLRTDSGFGLLGIRRLIHARDGTISATNAATGDGAVVTFTLPGKVSAPAG